MYFLKLGFKTLDERGFLRKLLQIGYLKLKI